MRFDNKIIIVTGGGRGIGKAISEQFLRQGAKVIVAQRSTPILENIHHIKADFADPESCRNVVEDTTQRFGAIDVLVNNAGMMEEARVEDMSIAAWDKTMAVNLRAPFILAKYAIPAMRNRGGGTIVNIGSIEGLGSNPNHAAYGASKAGLHALTRAIAVDEGQYGIRCNAVAPGWIDTELNNDFIASMPDPDAFKRDIGSIHPLRRTGTPEEVANLVVWLASDDASFITGQVFTIDGGRMAQLSLP